MKIAPLLIARALLDASIETPESEVPQLVDAAVSLFRSTQPGQPSRILIPLVTRVLRQKGLLQPAILTTPSGNAGTDRAKAIQMILSTATRQNVPLEENADDSLIGGASLRTGDERMEMSVRDALTRLSTYLTSPH